MPKFIEVCFGTLCDDPLPYGWVQGRQEAFSISVIIIMLMCSGIAQRSRNFLISVKSITEAHKGTIMCTM